MRRERILSRLRSRELQSVPLPEIREGWTATADLVAVFRDALEAAGGTLVQTTPDRLQDVIRSAPAITAAPADAIHCELERLGIASSSRWRDAETAARIQVAIVPGEFGVAENGAVWIREDRVSHRAFHFLAEHVILVVESGELVADLHQAYDRLDLGRPGFGAFVSGPSKTADIEQALVIGAHGPRTLTVVLVRPETTNPEGKSQTRQA